VVAGTKPQLLLGPRCPLALLQALLLAPSTVHVGVLSE
jgi:hypothetical protein